MTKELIDSIGNKKILVWGACRKTDKLVREFEEHNMDMAGYIDKKADEMPEYNKYKVYKSDILKDDKYFVYIGLTETYPEITALMDEYGYKEFEDFWYPARIIKLNGTENYTDFYGNMYKIKTGG